VGRAGEVIQVDETAELDLAEGVADDKNISPGGGLYAAVLRRIEENRLNRKRSRFGKHEHISFADLSSPVPGRCRDS